VTCPESLRLQAWLDGELDTRAGAEVQRHLAGCAACRQQQLEYQGLRAALRRELPPLQAPALLRQQLRQALDAEDAAHAATRAPAVRAPWRQRPFWLGAAGGFAAAGAALAIVFVLLLFPVARPVVDELLAAHVAALGSPHLVEVVSTDRHTVKPWFAGKADVSPVVADFSQQGFRLLGGRVEALRGQRAAVLVYQHGAHLIDVFCWPAPMVPLPGSTTRRGYHIAFWQSGDLAYAAVSDTDWEELARMERLLRGS
jgi:anti-sigma factor RsiW